MFDELYGRMWWIQQGVLGGYRLMAPASEADDVRSLLAQIRAAEPLPAEDALLPSGASAGRTALTLAAFLAGGAMAGWLFARGTGRRGPPMWMRLIGIVLLLLIAALGVSMAATMVLGV